VYWQNRLPLDCEANLSLVLLTKRSPAGALTAFT
jgi:hypothetical protein